MANNFTSNPIQITDAFTNPAFVAAGGLPTNSELMLKEVYWYNPSNIGDTFSLTQADGQTVIRNGRCEVANQSQVFRQWDLRIKNFTCPTLASGTLFLYYR